MAGLHHHPQPHAGFCCCLRFVFHWREKMEGEDWETQRRVSFPNGWDQAGAGGCRPAASMPGPRDLCPGSIDPVHLHPAASEQLPLEGAAHSQEQLAPLWSQSREASWAKRQPEAASRHREFTVSSSYKSGLKPCPWDQPPDSRDLCSSDC